MAIIGGITLILAALLMYKGKIYYASITYILADFCWIYLGIYSGQILGSVLIVIGTTLNLGVFIKMNKNIFVRDLNKL